MPVFYVNYFVGSCCVGEADVLKSKWLCRLLIYRLLVQSCSHRSLQIRDLVLLEGTISVEGLFCVIRAET